jgi:hypothetical protein
LDAGPGSHFGLAPNGSINVQEPLTAFRTGEETYAAHKRGSDLFIQPFSTTSVFGQPVPALLGSALSCVTIKSSLSETIAHPPMFMRLCGMAKLIPFEFVSLIIGLHLI